MRRRSIAIASTRIAGVVTALLVVFLFFDYAIATLQRPKDDARVAKLQQQAQSNAASARDLAAEQNRITLVRSTRKVRLYWLSILLIASSAAFIGSAKWLMELDGRQQRIIRKPVRVTRETSLAVPVSHARRAVSTTGIDLEFVDQIVAKEGTSKEAAIPILQALQAHYSYLPEEALQRVCLLTRITPAQIAGTSTFYSRFRRSPVGEHIVRVCHGTACYVSGARQITEEVRRHLEIPDGADTDPERMFTVEEVACLGCCSLAPVLMMDDRTSGNLTPSSACATLEAAANKEFA